MWRAPVGDGAKRTLGDWFTTLLIGAHVSTAGGLVLAAERGIETASDAIQIFNQSPRMWRPTNYTDADFPDFRDAIAGSRIDSRSEEGRVGEECRSRWS